MEPVYKIIICLIKDPYAFQILIDDNMLYTENVIYIGKNVSKFENYHIINIATLVQLNISRS